MPISHKIRQYRALLGFVHQGKILQSGEQAEEITRKQGIWQGFVHQILIGSLRGLGIGLLKQSHSPSLVVPWFDISCLFWVVVRLPFCPIPPILPQILSKVLERNPLIISDQINLIYFSYSFLN